MSEHFPLQSKSCPDCETGLPQFDRRRFLQTTTAAAVTAALPVWATAKEEPASEKVPDTLVKKLYDSLTEKQRPVLAFDWDYQDPQRKLLRTHVSNNWHITNPKINSDFFTNDQRDIIRAIFEGLYNPAWLPQIEKQLKDDAGGYGKEQNIAIFGKPGEGNFEFVMTGRHLTARCDGNTTEHMAFGGPIFYGHAAQGFNEKPDHPGNIFWPQALQANKVYEMLDGSQRKKALVSRRPAESAVGFRGSEGPFPGIPVSDMTKDQQAEVQKTLKLLLDPYRTVDQQEVRDCLDKQGGLEKCCLAFYEQGDLGEDGVWDNWRLEGPSFVWYFRGEPHVHVWVNVSNSHEVETNARG